jgi:manganese/zinc/iron transport system substrate-binding protein
MRTVIAFTFVVCIAAGLGCNNRTSEDRPSQQQNRPLITATTGMIGDVLTNILPPEITAQSLISSGIDPHLYKPTRSDIARMTSSRAVFINGLFLEGKMAQAFERLPAHGVTVINIGARLSKTLLLEPQNFEGQYDPHVWMDPVAWKEAVHVMKDAIIQLLPDHEAVVRERTGRYVADLDRIHEYGLKALHSVPESSRILVTAHDAFQYFGQRYGYQVLGIQGISTESEAGIKHIQNLVSVLVSQRIKAVFVESTVPDRAVQALIEGAQAQGHQVRIGGELFSDAMGLPNTYEGTYIGMVDHNFTVISRALGGSAPERGLQGKLHLP